MAWGDKTLTLITSGSLNTGGISGSAARLCIVSSVAHRRRGWNPIDCCFDLPNATLEHKRTQKQGAKALTGEKATASSVLSYCWYRHRFVLYLVPVRLFALMTHECREGLGKPFDFWSYNDFSNLTKGAGNRAISGKDLVLLFVEMNKAEYLHVCTLLVRSLDIWLLLLLLKIHMNTLNTLNHVRNNYIATLITFYYFNYFHEKLIKTYCNLLFFPE